MKTKIDFVTNSSCASFVISKKSLTDSQIDLIKNHIEVGSIVLHRDQDRYYDESDEWDIIESETEIKGETFMDNFDMLYFLLSIGVDEKDINYEGCYGESNR